MESFSKAHLTCKSLSACLPYPAVYQIRFLWADIDQSSRWAAHQTNTLPYLWHSCQGVARDTVPYFAWHLVSLKNLSVKTTDQTTSLVYRRTVLSKIKISYHLLSPLWTNASEWTAVHAVNEKRLRAKMNSRIVKRDIKNTPVKNKSLFK